jgi:hypothetical protein
MADGASWMSQADVRGYEDKLINLDDYERGAG